MNKPLYNQVKKLSTSRNLPALPAYESLTWPELPDNCEYVLVPKGLSLDDWDKLLKHTCNGLWPYGYNEKPFRGKGWKVDVVPNTPAPTTCNISYTEATANKQKLLSVESYFALQWLRLERKEEPVDRDTWTWLQKEDSFGLSDDQAPNGNWNSDDGRVKVIWNDVGRRDVVLGVRLPVGNIPKDSVLTPYSDTSSLELSIDSITINGVIYVRMER